MAQDTDQLFDKKLMTVAETAEVLRVSRVTLWRLVREGGIKSIKIRNRRFFEKEEVEKLLGQKG